MRYFVQVGAEAVELEVERRADGSYHVRGPEGRELAVSSLAQRGSAHTLLVAGRVVEVELAEGEARLGEERFSVHAQSERERASSRPDTSDTRSSKEIVAPMPGRIVRVSCAAGDSVPKGAPLIVIEAMKMQNELSAKADCVVRTVRVANGDSVDRGAVLVEFE